MKKFTLFIALVLTAVFGGKTTASAQTYETEEQIEWIKYAVDLTTAMQERNGIYLCHWDGKKTYKFVTAGGTYGTQAIATTRGIRMTIAHRYDNQYNNGYTFTCTLNNPSYGSCLGAEPSNRTTSENVYLDRGRGDGDRYFYWNITKLGDYTYNDNNQQKKAPYYSLYNKNSNESIGRYVTVSSKNNTLQLTTETNDYWLFIPRDAFRTVLLAVTHQTNIEVSGLFQNTRFVRYMDKGASWNWYTINKTSHGDPLEEDPINAGTGAGLGITEYGAYRSMAPGAESIKGITVEDHDGKPNITLDYAKSYGSFSAGEMKKPIVMRQQITNVRPGTYTITAQAFVSDDTGDMANKDNSNIGFLFAAGTSGVNQSAEVPVLNSDDQKIFTEDFYNYHKNVLTASASKYFRGNVAAGEYLATGGDYTLSSDAIYNPNTEFKTITLNVTVTAEEGEQTGTLTIGAAKYKEQGTLYIANIDIKYSGTYEFGINSYGTDNTTFSEENTHGIDGYKYGYARQFNLARDFGATNTSGDEIANPKWEALVLPVNLTTTQVRSTFGDNVQLSKLVGLANGGKQIRFKAVDLASDPNATAIHAGECYVIKVTKAPEVARNGSYTFQVYSNDEFNENKPVDVTYTGPIYQIAGVTRTLTLAELIKANEGEYANGVVKKTYTTNDGSLKFTGYFYWNQTPPTNAYVVSRGKMFYLNSESTWKNLTGTMWKLEDDNNGGDKKLSVDFGDGDITNGISDITVEGENNVNATGIYNLNGQKVSDGTSTENLSKGIYIVNGKKYVVR